MKWTARDWMMFLLVFAAAYCLCAYFTGFMILKQATNDTNKELRLAMVVLMSNMINSAVNLYQSRTNVPPSQRSTDEESEDPKRHQSTQNRE